MACSNITKMAFDLCEGSVGGIRTVYLADWKRAVAKIGDDGKNVESFAPATGETIEWHEYKFRKNTSSLTSTLNVQDDGSSMIGTDLVMQFSRMDTDKRLAINAMTYADVMAVVVDSNGTAFFLGNTNPLYVSAGEGVTGQNRTDSNHYSLTLHDDDADYPYTLTQTALDAVIANAKANDKELGA